MSFGEDWRDILRQLGPPPSSRLFYEAWAAWEDAKRIEEASPRPREIRASHRVPYGQAFRQYLTDGSMVLWANRGEIADLPHRKVWGVDVALSTIAPPGGFGIPVVIDE